MSASTEKQTGPSLGLIKEGEIKSLRELGKEEHHEFTKAKSNLMQFTNDQQLFGIARLNYVDFDELIARYFREYAKNSAIDWTRMERMVLETNRLILNFLSAVRTFLDQSEFNLKKRYGKNSERVKRFKEACSQAYANEFSYRFVYRLRNYVQHCGMPVGTFSLGSRLVNTATTEVTHYLALYFNRDELLEKYDSWGPQLEVEIKSLPMNIEVNPHIRTVMNCIGAINQVIVRDDLPDLERDIQVIKKLVAEANRSNTGTPCILYFSKSPSSTLEVQANIEWIPLHMISIFTEMQLSKESQDQTPNSTSKLA